MDGFGSRDLQVFAEAKPSIQLHTQVLNALFPLDFMFPENDPRVFEGSPVRDQQSLGLFRGHFQASAIQPTLCQPQTIITALKSRLEDDLTLEFVKSKLIDEYERQKGNFKFCQKSGHQKKDCTKYKR